MATVDSRVGIVEFALWKLSKGVSERARIKETRAVPWVQGFVRLMLHLAGFVGLTIGAFNAHIVAGYAVAGLSCFALSWLLTTTPAGKSSDSPQQTQRR